MIQRDNLWAYDQSVQKTFNKKEEANENLIAAKSETHDSLSS